MKQLTFILIILFIVLPGCRKYLDKKPDQKLAVVTKVEDLQALLDQYSDMNNKEPGADEVSADNFYVTAADWSSRTEVEQRMYTWQPDRVFAGYPNNNWHELFKVIYIANTCLESIEKLERNLWNAAAWDNVKGSALYFRAKSYLKAAFIWAPAYDVATASEDIGMPLRVTSDFNLPSVRATVQATYDLIVSDLKASLPLLPKIPVHVMRPSLPAAYGLLARTYLSMRQYDSCLKYATLCLEIKNDLLDFNTEVKSSATYPVAKFNKEVLHEGLIPTPALLANSRAKIDTFLYNSYDDNDLRKTIFFSVNANGSVRFRGSYEGAGSLFAGVATDEIYLMRAECYARAGDDVNAMKDLNTLMEKRWKAGLFTPFTAADADDALAKILTERRKELLMRGLRWMDIKRFNKEGANIFLKRNLDGAIYELPPNDPRYALAIPEDVIAVSGMAQNKR